MSKQSEELREKLKLLQSKADKILDEIDETEVEILRIEEEEAKEALFDLIVKRGKILAELKSKCSLSKKIYVDDKNEDILYLRDRRSDLKLAAFVYDDHSLEEFEEWVQLQIESFPFYLELIEHHFDDLSQAEVYQPIGVYLNESQYLTLNYQPDTYLVTITHHDLITYNQVEEMISKAYDDGRKFRKSGIVDSYEIILTSSHDSFCNLVDLVKTIGKIKAEARANEEN